MTTPLKKPPAALIENYKAMRAKVHKADELVLEMLHHPDATQTPHRSRYWRSLPSANAAGHSLLQCTSPAADTSARAVTQRHTHGRRDYEMDRANTQSTRELSLYVQR